VIKYLTLESEAMSADVYIDAFCWKKKKHLILILFYFLRKWGWL